MDEIWSRAKYYTSYNDYITANPSSQTSNDDSDVVYKLKHQFQIFSITHRDHVVAEIQLCTSPIVLGDVFQLVADFSNAFYSCEQVRCFSLFHNPDGCFLMHGRVFTLLERSLGEIHSCYD